MRSYETSQYSICKDGNFQLTFARIVASNFDSIQFAVPYQSSDLEEFLDQNEHLIKDRDISIRNMFYGVNAVDTRKTFWDLNAKAIAHGLFEEFDLVITDITGYPGKTPYINNFNVTKLPELDRPYIDEFFEQDIKAMEGALFTTVINPRQREYILEKASHLKDKVFAYTKVAHSQMMPSDNKTRIFTPQREIFWPFRISDKAYKFNEFLEVFIEAKLDRKYKIVITDPNDTYKGDHKFITKIKLSKQEYYEKLQKKPIVVMLDDIDTVLHPGTIEFMHYNCPVITLLNELVGNSLQVETISEIPQLLDNLSYNNRTNTRDFVYSYKEKSEKYNKEFVSKCLPSS